MNARKSTLILMICTAIAFLTWEAGYNAALKGESMEWKGALLWCAFWAAIPLWVWRFRSDNRKWKGSSASRFVWTIGGTLCIVALMAWMAHEALQTNSSHYGHMMAIDAFLIYIIARLIAVKESGDIQEDTSAEKQSVDCTA
jgi:hypothetical protein